MFNPLSPPAMMLAVGRVLKDAAGGGAEDDWQRGQLLSAYSVSRHLAAELGSEQELRAWFGSSVAETIRAGALGVAHGPELEREAGRIESGESGPAIGASMCALMGVLREDGSPEASALAADLRSLMRELCDREVAALAAAGS